MNTKIKDEIGKNMELEKLISPILVVNNNSLRPYIEAFHYEPENVIQQPLGTLVGYFEVREYSEDSAYIVNFLTSVLKKEYYINAKRPIAESLDAALHKANVALSELAKHGNVNWLGHLDAAICVLEKNSLHFSVAGSGNILLSRRETFTSISSGLASEESQLHPLKTFVQVASGRIEKDDMVLIASHVLFSILPIKELKKNNARLSEEQFVQFLKTALSNELEVAYASCISIKKIAPTPVVKKTRPAKNTNNLTNAFSEKAFAPPKVTEKSTDSFAGDVDFVENESSTETEFDGKQNGHIYIEGEQPTDIQENSRWKEGLIAAKEQLADWSFNLRSRLRRRANMLKKDLSQFAQDAAAKRAAKKIQREEELLAKQNEPTIPEKDTAPIQKKISTDIKTPLKPIIVQPKKKHPEQLGDEKSHQIKEFFTSTKQPSAPAEALPKEKISNPFIRKISQLKVALVKRFKEFRESEKGLQQKQEKSPLLSLLPSIARIRSAFLLLSKNQKISVLVIIILIIFIPLLAIKISSKKETAKTIPEVIQQPSRAELLANETNIALQPNTKLITTTSDSSFVISTKQDSFAFTKNTLISLSNDNGKEFAIPQEFGKPLSVSYMKDLDLIFILSDNKKIISFSPTTKQFKDNTISLQFSQQPPFIATYLTYLYVPDTANNKINRYPRAEGGFGEPTSWLKDGVSLTQATDGTIDENIYVAQGDKVIKLFKGKQADFTLQTSQTPVSFDKIYTTLDSKYLYVLDKGNARVIKFDKTSGNLIKQYFSESFSDGTSLSANFNDTLVYVAAPQGVIELTLD